MTKTETVDGKVRALSWTALGVVYVVWGSTYLAIRVGVRDVPPLVFAGTRFLIAGSLLYPIARRLERHGAESNSGRQRTPAKAWFSCAALGVLLLFAGNGGVTVAERTIPSGLAALLVATVPLWMLVFAWPLQKQRIYWGAALGLAIGVIGVAILVDNGTASGRASGVVTVLAGAASWGFGSVLARRLPLPSNAMLAAAIEMLFGGIALLVCAAASGEFARVDWSSIRATSWIAFAYLIPVGSILGLTAYNYALSHLPVTVVSTYAFANPVIAVLAGSLILGEHLAWSEGFGAVLVVASICIVLRLTHGSARRIATTRRIASPSRRRLARTANCTAETRRDAELVGAHRDAQFGRRGERHLLPLNTRHDGS